MMDINEYIEEKIAQSSQTTMYSGTTEDFWRDAMEGVYNFTKTGYEHILKDLVDTVECTGGVITNDKTEIVLADDEEWLDLASVYMRACNKLGVEPMLDQADCHFCGKRISAESDYCEFCSRHTVSGQLNTEA